MIKEQFNARVIQKGQARVIERFVTVEAYLYRRLDAKHTLTAHEMLLNGQRDRDAQPLFLRCSAEKRIATAHRT